MIEILAYVGCFIFACLAIFQIALVAGAPIGRFAWGGKNRILPMGLRVGSVIAVLLYVLFAAVLLTKAGVATLIDSEVFVDVTLWIITGYLFIGIIMNAISRSKPERFVMTPVAAILAAVFLIVGLGG